ncbi:MAG: hypothetical protein K8E24_013360 [Methanobacterium paludis]|nr:hypothetical protein [Methanobacterium paludis]
MYEYLKKHEKYINDLLNSGEGQDWERIRKFHNEKIMYLQHERLIHLMVTLVFSLYLITSLIVSCIHFLIPLLILDLVLAVFMIFYILHYYRLENGVQRWYLLTDKIEDKIKNVRNR